MASLNKAIAGMVLIGSVVLTNVVYAAPVAGLVQIGMSLRAEAGRLPVERVASYSHSQWRNARRYVYKSRRYRHHWYYGHASGQLPTFRYFPPVVASREFYWRPNFWSPDYHPFYW